MLKTEMRNENTKNIDKMSALEIVQAMSNENYNAVKAVEAASEAIARAIDGIYPNMKNGGRIIYIGAGTSGRLGVLDASECPPTFGVDSNTVVGIIAGGYKCLVSAAENAEDLGGNGVQDLKNVNLTALDTVVGISASGGARYIIDAVKYANSIGALTVGVTSNGDSDLFKESQIGIFTDTGAEVITGSTRLKAGTAQKLVLNAISTGVMIKMGYVAENLMINLKPTNKKLRKRVISITRELSGKSEEDAVSALEKCDWVIREAIK